MLSNLHPPYIELSSLAMLMLMLYWLKRSIGNIPVYLLIGLFFIFGQVSLLPAFTESFLETGQLTFLTYGLLLLPVVMMYLLVYELEGTMEAQRFIFGMIIMVIAFIYIIQLILGQYHPATANYLPRVIQILTQPRLFFLPLTLLTSIHAFLMLLLPITYQLLRNIRIPVLVSMFLHISIFDLVSLAVQKMLTRDMHVTVHFPNNVIVSWLLSVALISAFAHFYVKLSSRHQTNSIYRGPFSILSTLLTHVYQAGQFRQSVEEWAGKYQAVFDNTSELIFLVDENCAVINANRAAVNTMGPMAYESGYILAQRLFDGDKQPINWNEAFNKLKGPEKKKLIFSDKLLQLKDGFINVECNISPVSIYDMPMAIIIMKDVTLERQKELEHKRIEESMMHSQRLEALGTLAGGVAHDFNNLLCGIQTSCELLHKEPINHQAQSLLANVEHATIRAAELTNKLLGFARKGKYQEQLLDATAIAKSAAELFRIGLKNVDFKCLVEPGTFVILGDETQLQQVILNLLLNAKDALKTEENASRKITLRVGKPTEELVAWKKRPENAMELHAYVAIRVKDNGQGIPPDIIDHIFEPFFTTKEHKGTGLGLPMAYGCVTHHHGWITADSTPEKGTELTILLPLAPLMNQSATSNPPLA